MYNRQRSTKHIIWSNDLDYEDWREDLEQEFPDASEDERIQIMYETNAEYLYDERTNLDINTGEPIIGIADLGLWYGRVSGYAIIQSGFISDCLVAHDDYNTWYVDRYGDLRGDGVHHDGVNHYLYRTFKPHTTLAQRQNLMRKIYEGTATRKDITRVTDRLGDYIGDVYGWNFPRRTITKN